MGIGFNNQKCPLKGDEDECPKLGFFATKLNFCKISQLITQLLKVSKFDEKACLTDILCSEISGNSLQSCSSFYIKIQGVSFKSWQLPRSIN